MPRKRLSNADLAELLAVEADSAKSPLAAKALRKASRLALSWEVEAGDLAAQTLTQLAGVGPYIAKLLADWIGKGARIQEKHSSRLDFLTKTQARQILEATPGWAARYKGDLHMHTRWSDGSATVSEMAAAAMERGYSYIAIADHSKGLKIANGLDEARLAGQAEEIDGVNAALRDPGKAFTVLKSLEVNLDPQGNCDMAGRTLARLDLVIGSFHSALRKKEDQTKRYLAALRNPHIHILGHPRGRIYNYREGLTADWEKVFACAAEQGKAVEVDSFPDRQDLNVELLRLARKADCLVAIDTDAHHPWQLEFAEFGLAAALEAGIEPKRIVNFFNAEDLLGTLKI